MNQTRIGSLIEAVINTAIGFGISMLLAVIVYPLFGHSFTMAQNLGITCIFTVVSIARGYILRRWFNAKLQLAAARMARAVQ